MNCLFCNKELENAIPDDMGYSPHKGGHVIFNFGYGSVSFDNCCGTTKFSAMVCDECASKYVKNMKEEHIDNLQILLDKFGPQKSPSSVNKIEAEVKQVKVELNNDQQGT